jgi:hypothetical protein
MDARTGTARRTPIAHRACTNHGDVAQLAERCARTAEATGSKPVISTNKQASVAEAGDAPG